MAYEQSSSTRGQGYSLQLVAPTAISGLTVTTTPSTNSVLNDATGEETTSNNAEVSGEFYSFFLSPGASITLFTSRFVVSSLHYIDNVTLNIENEESQNGNFVSTSSIISTDSNNRPTEIELRVTFVSNEESIPSYKPAILSFESTIELQAVAVSSSKVIRSTTFPKQCSNIRQNLTLGVMASLGSQFKVTCTAAGISNIIPDTVHTAGVDEGTPEEDVIQRTLYAVRVPIPARTPDTTWTITIVPQTGTANSSNISALTLKQLGLKTVTFTDDVSGIANTTFPNNVTTLSHGSNVNRRFYDASSEDLNSRRKDYRPVTIVITSTSGNNTIKTSFRRPTIASSFTNITGSGIIIKDITAVQTSATVVTLSFNMKVTKLLANVSSAIKLSDFLTNG